MIKKTLELYKSGDIGLKEAEHTVTRCLYEQGSDFLLDLHREKRIGFPEIVFSQGKTIDHIITITSRLFENQHRVFISAVDDHIETELRKSFPGSTIEKAGRLMLIKKHAEPTNSGLGTAGIITAGTADTPYANECALILAELGAEVINAFDFGASGMHRPALSLKQTKHSDVLIVFAGMDGVLPTLIASLTALPIIAVPTPIGYGFGGRGEAALKTMLQSCVPGVMVMNIGNSIGAAAAAVRILKSMHRDDHETDKRDQKID